MDQSLRLIEQEPALELHALLRFLKLEYFSDFTYSERALDLPVPVIITTGKKLGLHGGRQACLKAIVEISGIEIPKELSLLDAMFSSYIQTHFSDPLDQYLRHKGSRQTTYLNALPLGLNAISAWAADFKDFFLGNSIDKYPDATEANLESILIEGYSQLNSQLKSRTSISILSSKDLMLKDCPVFNTLLATDALVFGHIARGMSDTKLSEEIKKLPLLLEFFNLVVDKTFHQVAPSQRNQASIRALIENPFLRGEQFDWLKEAILPGHKEKSKLLTAHADCNSTTQNIIDSGSELVNPFSTSFNYKSHLSGLVFIIGVGACFGAYFVRLNRRNNF